MAYVADAFQRSSLSVRGEGLGVFLQLAVLLLVVSVAHRTSFVLVHDLVLALGVESCAVFKRRELSTLGKRVGDV